MVVREATTSSPGTTTPVTSSSQQDTESGRPVTSVTPLDSSIKPEPSHAPGRAGVDDDVVIPPSEGELVVTPVTRISVVTAVSVVSVVTPVTAVSARSAN